MNIAQFTESFPPVVNGAAVAAELITEALGARHQVEVFAPRYPGFVDTRLVHRFPSYAWPHMPDYPLAIPISRRIAELFRKGRFEVVHTHSPFTLGQIGRRWARRHRLPVVTTYHTLYVEYAHYARLLPAPLVRGYLRRLSISYCNACDAVVVPTAPIRDVLLGYGVRRPIHIIPTGLKLRAPPAPDPAFPRGQFGIPPEAPLALYAGRLAREKNLDLLFSAFARVAARVPEARLLIAGGGPIEAKCRRTAAALGIGERVVFAGFVPPERMPQVYAAADVFAFSSRADTQGLVLTEAKAAGVPAVSVDACGPSTVVSNGVDGFLTPPEPEAFGAALARLLTDRPLRDRMSAAALRESRRFSIEATAAAYEQVYAEAAARLTE